MEEMPEINKVWGPGTLARVRHWWGRIPPWAIAREINIFLRWRAMAFSKADGTPRRAAPVTSLYGGGVIWKAWELGLFEGEEWRDELRAIAKGQCKPYLESLCQHDLAIKKCFGCYMALDTTGVLLYNTEEEKSLFVEAADWSLFEADLAQDPKGYEILAIREPFSPPSYG